MISRNIEVSEAWATPVPQAVEPIVGPRGLPGESILGPPGEPGVSVKAAGIWNRKKLYQENSIVTHMDSAYIGRKESKGKIPTAKSASWMLLIKKPKDGDTIQGPKGRPGRPAEADNMLSSVAVFVLGQVVQATPGGTDFQLAQADSLTNATAVVGIAADRNKIQTGGLLTGLNVTLTPGAPVYLSPTVAGGLTSTAPTTIGQVVQCVGEAVTSNSINIEIAKPILL